MPSRILSLLPSATEIVCALGLAERLVGVSHDCDFPPEVVRLLPRLSTTTIPLEGPSRSIDEAVRRGIHQGRSIYHIDPVLLAKLSPDLILTQELCEVCAPAYTEVMQAARRLETASEVISLEPLSLAGVLENIRLVGELTGATGRAEQLTTEIRDRLEAVGRRVMGEPRPTVFCMEWLDPPLFGGHWVPEMAELAGGRDLFGTPGQKSAYVEWDRVLDLAPEVIVLMPCGFHLDRVLAQRAEVTGRPGWDKLPAVRSKRVFAVDGSSYFNRPGPRLVDGVEILASILHPDLLRYPHPEGRVTPVH